VRTYEESCALLDRIVGRCVRDEAFGYAVLADPDAALSDYELNEDELDDFRALKARHRDEAAATWAAIRMAMEAVRARRHRA
jgi:hypothetical protein